MREKDFYTHFLSFQAKYSIWTISDLVERILLVPEVTKHQTQTPVYASIYADIYGGKVQIWKERDLNVYFSSFLQCDSKKEKHLFFFLFFFTPP